ncbi:hypothetical protein [Microcystis phage Mae-Yong1326-1]|nr:hypothetical protein [Microcystis phage Mae-Yong1326-1]
MSDDNDDQGGTEADSTFSDFLRQLREAASPPPATLQDILEGRDDGSTCGCAGCNWLRDFSRRLDTLIADTPPWPQDEGEAPRAPAENAKLAARSLLAAAARRLAVAGDDGLAVVHSFAHEFRLTRRLLEAVPVAAPEGKAVTHAEGGRA